MMQRERQDSFKQWFANSGVRQVHREGRVLMRQVCRGAEDRRRRCCGDRPRALRALRVPCGFWRTEKIGPASAEDGVHSLTRLVLLSSFHFTCHTAGSDLPALGEAPNPRWRTGSRSAPRYWGRWSPCRESLLASVPVVAAFCFPPGCSCSWPACPL